MLRLFLSSSQRMRSHILLTIVVMIIHSSSTLNKKSNEVLRAIHHSIRCLFIARLSLNLVHMRFYTLLRHKITGKVVAVVYVTKCHFSGLGLQYCIMAEKHFFSRSLKSKLSLWQTTPGSSVVANKTNSIWTSHALIFTWASSTLQS